MRWGWWNTGGQLEDGCHGVGCSDSSLSATHRGRIHILPQSLYLRFPESSKEAVKVDRGGYWWNDTTTQLVGCTNERVWINSKIKTSKNTSSIQRENVHVRIRRVCWGKPMITCQEAAMAPSSGRVVKSRVALGWMSFPVKLVPDTLHDVFLSSWWECSESSWILGWAADALGSPLLHPPLLEYLLKHICISEELQQ